MPRRAARAGFGLLAILALLAAAGAWSRTAAQGGRVPSGLADELAAVLHGRRIAAREAAPSAVSPRGEAQRDIYRQAVRSVALVLNPKGHGSGVVVRTDGDAILLLTNHHVTDPTFKDASGEPILSVVFFDPVFAGHEFERKAVGECLREGHDAAWCPALRRAVRTARVLRTDANRDLALLRVPSPPREAVPIRLADLGTVEPGDDVAVIGHPKGFLWSLTTGVVSAVRSHYTMHAQGTAKGTVIQTQAPISPGNSGGPLLTLQGRLLGIMAWTFDAGQNINAAVAVNEVQAFLNEAAR